MYRTFVISSITQNEKEHPKGSFYYLLKSLKSFAASEAQIELVKDNKKHKFHWPADQDIFPFENTSTT